MTATLGLGQNPHSHVCQPGAAVRCWTAGPQQLPEPGAQPRSVCACHVGSSHRAPCSQACILSIWVDLAGVTIGEPSGVCVAESEMMHEYQLVETIAQVTGGLPGPGDHGGAHPQNKAIQPGSGLPATRPHGVVQVTGRVVIITCAARVGVPAQAASAVPESFILSNVQAPPLSVSVVTMAGPPPRLSGGRWEVCCHLLHDVVMMGFRLYECVVHVLELLLM